MLQRSKSLLGADKGLLVGPPPSWSLLCIEADLVCVRVIELRLGLGLQSSIEGGEGGEGGEDGKGCEVSH